jgi:cell division protein YceG involved in septum cleavage
MKTLLKLIVLVMLAVAGWLTWRLQQPFNPPAGGVFVDIPRGSGTRAIAAQLATERVIESPLLFLTVRALRPK